MNDFSIRTMGRQEVDWAVEMAAKEGWNPGLNDANPFFDQDPNGFILGLLGDKPIGCISAVSYGGVFGFIGFYIVERSHRGKGFGIQLWKAAIERLKGYVIGLDGVFEQQDNYRKSGFTFQYSNIRFEYRNTLSHAAKVKSIAINAATPDDIAAIATYDQEMFPVRREDFLGHWLNQPKSVALTAHKEGILAGYGVIRPCRVGYKIGPLFADTADIAEELFCNLCSRVEAESSIYLDVPEINEKGMLLTQKHNMQRVFGTARMYAGAAPRLNLEKIFGVTTFELG